MKRTVVLSLLVVNLVASAFGPTSRAWGPETDRDLAEPVAWLAGPDNALPPSQNWMPLPAGETHWYAFDYQGHLEAGRGKKKAKPVWVGSQIHILLDAESDRGAAFSIWTPAQVRRWALGQEVEPVGRGTKNALEPGDLFWSGNFAAPGRYFIVVEHRGSEPSRLKLTIRSQGVFVPTVRQTAQNLQDEGYGAVEIGSALSVLGQDAQAAGQTLKDVAFPAIGVGQALKDAFGLDGTLAGQILKDVGFPAIGVGQALKDAFGLDAQAAAQVLKAVGFSAEETAVALRDPNGYNIQDAALVASALKDAFGLDATLAAQILKGVGFSAEETAVALRDPDGYNIQDAAVVATVLKDAFDLEAAFAAQVLKDLGFNAVEIAVALKDPRGFNIQDATDAAKALIDISSAPKTNFRPVPCETEGAECFEYGFLYANESGFSLDEIRIALTNVYQLSDLAAAQTLAKVGFLDGLAEKFAPILKFDSEASEYGFPSSAGAYYQKVYVENTSTKPNTLCLLFTGLIFSDCDHVLESLDNLDPQSIQRNKVPTYFKVVYDGTQVRIMYWWFYAYQRPCFASGKIAQGGHATDWERIMVTLTENQSDIAAVTYWQHSGWYTRIRGPHDTCNPAETGRCGGERGFEKSGDHPVVYVEKIAHGSNHEPHETSIGGCGYWDGFRSGTGGDMATWNNLVPLDPSRAPEEERAWMEKDLTTGVGWINNPMKTIPNYDLKACHDSYPLYNTLGSANGCYKSEGFAGDSYEAGHVLKECEPNYTNGGYICTNWDSSSLHSYGRLNSGKFYHYDFVIPSTDLGLARRRNRENPSEWNLPYEQ